MAKLPAKKTAAKKTAAKRSLSPKSSSAKTGAKGKSGSRIPAKKTGRVVITEKERELREANLLANSEKKKKPAVRKRKKTATAEQTSGLLEAIVEGLQERKAKHITILNLSKIENRVTDYFVICDADSNTHVNSIADSVEDTVLKLTNEKAYHIEGRQNGEWILIDYINIVVHIFLREAREHYNVEGLWGDAESTTIND